MKVCIHLNILNLGPHSNVNLAMNCQRRQRTLHRWGTTENGVYISHRLSTCGFWRTFTNKYACMRASQFIIENIDSDAVNELDTYIMNNEALYRRRFMPIISNIRRKLAKNVYDHEKAQKLWMYLVDDAAKEYVKEFGSTQDDVSNMFPKETRQQVARVKSDRELENIKAGEYDAPKGTVS